VQCWTLPPQGWLQPGDLEKIPFTLLTETRGINLIEHTVAVTLGAAGIAKAITDTYAAMPYEINWDYLYAGGLLHDVGKCKEIEFADGKYRKSFNGKCTRIPSAAAHSGARVGLPDEIVNIVACHAKRATAARNASRPYFMFPTRADFATFDPMVMMVNGTSQRRQGMNSSRRFWPRIAPARGEGRRTSWISSSTSRGAGLRRANVVTNLIHNGLDVDSTPARTFFSSTAIHRQRPEICREPAYSEVCPSQGIKIYDIDAVSARTGHRKGCRTGRHHCEHRQPRQHPGPWRVRAAGRTATSRRAGAHGKVWVKGSAVPSSWVFTG
jgi:hypothetical protein